MNHHRSEHWILSSSHGKVEIDKNMKIISQNETTYIPLKSLGSYLIILSIT